MRRRVLSRIWSQGSERSTTRYSDGSEVRPIPCRDAPARPDDNSDAGDSGAARRNRRRNRGALLPVAVGYFRHIVFHPARPGVADDRLFPPDIHLGVDGERAHRAATRHDRAARIPCRRIELSHARSFMLLASGRGPSRGGSARAMGTRLAHSRAAFLARIPFCVDAYRRSLAYSIALRTLGSCNRLERRRGVACRNRRPSLRARCRARQIRAQRDRRRPGRPAFSPFFPQVRSC